MVRYSSAIGLRITMQEVRGRESGRGNLARGCLWKSFLKKYYHWYFALASFDAPHKIQPFSCTRKAVVQMVRNTNPVPCSTGTATGTPTIRSGTATATTWATGMLTIGSGLETAIFSRLIIGSFLFFLQSLLPPTQHSPDLVQIFRQFQIMPIGNNLSLPGNG